MLPTDKQQRKERPIFRGVMAYFPDALAEVARVSYVGSQQHQPGESMRWDRNKSVDQEDCIARHLLERGQIDDDGMRHSAKLAWRALALLQLEIEADQAKTASRVGDHADWAPPIRGSDSPLDPIYGIPFTDDDSCISVGGFPCQDISSAKRPECGLYKAPIEPEIPYAAMRDVVHPVDLAEHSQTYINARNIQEAVERAVHQSMRPRKPAIYISGPMRGRPKQNFPAFDEAARFFRYRGYAVVNPADMDRNDPRQLTQREYARRDCRELIDHVDSIAMLRGWEHSTGATAEFFLARWLGLRILDAETGEPLKEPINWAGIENSTRRFLADQIGKVTK